MQQILCFCRSCYAERAGGRGTSYEEKGFSSFISRISFESTPSGISTASTSLSECVSLKKVRSATMPAPLTEICNFNQSFQTTTADLTDEKYLCFTYFAGLVVRVPFLEVDHFAHKNKNNLIGIERDVQLRREMLIVRSREAKIHMVHTFDHVPPGRYTIQLRLRLTDPGAYATSNRTSVPAGTPPARLTVGLAASNGPRGCSCDANPAEHCDNHNSFRISSNSGGGSSNNNTIVNQVITVKNWCSICDHQHVSQPSLPYMESARVIYDRDSDWFFLRLNTFKLTGASSNLRVEFRDEIQHGWKKHMIWDFIELREVKYI